MKNAQGKTRSGRAAVVLLIGLASMLPTPALAARVYGLIRDPNGKPLVQGTLIVLGAKGETIRSITTSDTGCYTVFLKPGLYRLELDGTWEASLQAFEESTEQNIWLTPKKK